MKSIEEKFDWEKDNWCVSIVAEALTFAKTNPIGDASHITKKLRDKIDLALESQMSDLRKEVEKKRQVVEGTFASKMLAMKFNSALDEVLLLMQKKIINSH